MTTPFYSDWTFWSFVVASIAVVLSQIPPIKQLLKKNKLEVELYEMAAVTHTLGNPNFTIHLSITNTGANELKIGSINCNFEHNDGDKFTTKANSYFENSKSENAVFLPTFKIKPGESWSHAVLFFNRFNRTDDKTYRLISGNLKKNIQRKHSLLANSDDVIEADEQFVEPVINFYDKHKNWKAGEYTVTLSVITEPNDASLEKQFRFTLYESDIEQLESYKDQFKFGLGVYFFNANEQEPVFVPIIPV